MNTSTCQELQSCHHSGVTSNTYFLAALLAQWVQDHNTQENQFLTLDACASCVHACAGGGR
jgi:hypothetical protein